MDTFTSLEPKSRASRRNSIASVAWSESSRLAEIRYRIGLVGIESVDSPEKKWPARQMPFDEESFPLPDLDHPPAGDLRQDCVSSAGIRYWISVPGAGAPIPAT